jgi:hypothetical protein
MGWVTVDGLEQHWTRARVDAERVAPDVVRATTTNVSALTFSITNSYKPAPNATLLVALDGQVIRGPSVSTDGSWTAHFEKQKNRWKLISQPSDDRLRKRHGLQGPIDDAFMDSFIFVRPTGKPMNDQIGEWTSTAMSDAIREWRLQFRGETPIKDDTSITDADIANSNLILWGDPHSNRLFARIAPILPLHWDRSKFTIAGTTYSFHEHVPILIYPNPLNPKHYVVLNSGFTFADEAPTSNALQIPKLPDYAVINLNTHSVDSAGFFDEYWQYAKYH